jgi:hypothetical protein
VDLGANAIYDDATFVYFGDVVTPDELKDLYNTDLIAFLDHVRPVPGGGIAPAHQVDRHQLDVFFIGEDGGLYVSWVIDEGRWQGPVRISSPGVAPNGAGLATAHQTNDSQADVFFVGGDRPNFEDELHRIIEQLRGVTSIVPGGGAPCRD